MYGGQSLSHMKWECKYHIVWIPKYRKKAIFEDLRKYLGEIFRDLTTQKECKVVEGHLMPDHVHILISIPPKHSVSQVVGFIKGKSAIQIAKNFRDEKRILLVNTSGQEDIMCRRLVRMRMPCESISKSRRKKTNALSN